MQIFWERVETTAKTAGCERFERRFGGGDGTEGPNGDAILPSETRQAARITAVQRPPALQSRQIGIEVGDGLDAAEIIFQRDVLVGSMSVFVGQAEAEQNARHLEGVVHLCNKGN
jgi:hypothetical protein